MDFHFKCPNTKCNQELKAELKSAGRRCSCPSCGTDFRIPQPPKASAPPPPPAGSSGGRPVSSGNFTCPVCWERFNSGEMMHIAAHDSLRGDAVLGKDAQQRFFATRFNNAGQALDAMGLAAFDIACPHCRRKLPLGFLDIKHHIISLVGDQSAGKSYFLAVMMKVFPGLIFQKYGVIFADSDPTANAPLNSMRNALFTAETASQAKLAKTVFEGEMYERLPRQGRMVALPKPFVYTLTPSDKSQKHALIFYDNAGEHFQPGVNIVEQPGAQHVASAAGIIFLFDPLNSPEFRIAITDNLDRPMGHHISLPESQNFSTMPTIVPPMWHDISLPNSQNIKQKRAQFEKPVVDQQDIILAEMRVRIQAIRNLRPDETPNTPVAFVVGKCDTWLQLLNATPLRDESATEWNSKVIRKLLISLCPAVVANAELLSSNIMYFATSSFGHTPVKIGPGEYAPDPKQLKPIQVETPLLWILSQVAPSLLSGTGPRDSEKNNSSRKK